MPFHPLSENVRKYEIYRLLAGVLLFYALIFGFGFCWNTNTSDMKAITFQQMSFIIFQASTALMFLVCGIIYLHLNKLQKRIRLLEDQVQELLPDNNKAFALPVLGANS